MDGIGTVSCSTRSPSPIQQFAELTLGLIVFTAYQAALDHADGLGEQVERQTSGNKPRRTERKKNWGQFIKVKKGGENSYNKEYYLARHHLDSKIWRRKKKREREEDLQKKSKIVQHHKINCKRNNEINILSGIKKTTNTNTDIMKEVVW